ncbi:hypothetical protein FHS14_003678 [Paenibacillus baekrokdamisoli]|nr:hypothetical protein [Paenibacillus baekrokdamisoli]
MTITNPHSVVKASGIGFSGIMLTPVDRLTCAL